MINLLPANNKRQLRASLHNTLLRKHIGLLLVFTVALGAVIAYSYFVLKSYQEFYQETEHQNNLRVVEYQELKRKANDLSQDLNLSKTILSQRVDYSQVLIKIAQILPEGVSIDAITLESKLFEGSKTLEVNLTHSDQASDIKKLFEESDLFKSVIINNVVSDDHVCKASYNVVFNREGFGL